MKTPAEIVNLMLKNDHFSNWLNLEVDLISLGHCRLRTTISQVMLNGHSIAHGGISYSLADSALAFAANSRGQKAVSIETSIQHIAPAYEGDILIADCVEVHCGKTVGRYEARVENQRGELIAKFTGTVFRSVDQW
jgi:acyl-CoA thioesterase